MDGDREERVTEPNQQEQGEPQDRREQQDEQQFRRSVRIHLFRCDFLEKGRNYF